MTQKSLGTAVGFDERNADIRMAQYESGTRTPKEKIASELAGVLEVSPLALSVPDIDSYMGLAHTLFALEDLYGLGIRSIDGELCLTLDKDKGPAHQSMLEIFNAWQQAREKLANGEITKEEYDQWRYRYPEFDITQVWAKVPPMELSDYLVKRLDKKELTDA